jgi:hypothetical protein
MSEYTERPGDGADEEVVEALRELYAAPGGEGYWDGLEARIMAQVAGDRGSVWPFFARWAPAGLLAAAAALLMAGYALQRVEAEEASVAYETALRNASPMAVQTVMGRPGTPVREATFEYVITH